MRRRYSRSACGSGLSTLVAVLLGLTMVMALADVGDNASNDDPYDGQEETSSQAGGRGGQSESKREMLLPPLDTLTP